MSLIKILPKNLIDKIAAGEVVERPSSVVKELVENSIDAKADEIIVEIKDGGKRLIRVSDNGAGMAKEDLVLCVKSHATSKIKSIDDLFTISTMGFRGEALPSISAVSKIQIRSKSKNQIAGNQIGMQGCGKFSLKEIGAKEGTTVEVRDLFFNVPARKKFLKSKNTEYSHIIGTLSNIALANPHISFELINNGRKVFKLGKGNKVRVRIWQLLGKEMESGILSLMYNSPYLEISGYIGKPEIARNSRANQYLFVNKRPVYDKLISSAIYEGYRGFLEKGEYPVFFVFVNINPDLVDVNVHPQKREIKFQNQRMVYSSLKLAVKSALSRSELIPKVKPGSFKMPEFKGAKFSRAANANQVEPALKMSKLVLNDEQKFRNKPVFSGKPIELDLSKGQSINEGREDSNTISPLAQIHNTYILVESKNGLRLIDQHAAHERLLFEKFNKQAQTKGNSQSQKLLVFETVEFSQREIALIRKNKERIETFGFSIEDFGKNTVKISAIPTFLTKVNVKKFFKGVVDDLLNSIEIKKIKNQKERIVSTMACRAAVKAGDKLNQEEIAEIVRMVSLENLKTCPHGRPVMVELTLKEIEKMFGRRK